MSLLTGVQPVDTADMLRYLWQFHMTRERVNVEFWLPTPHRWAPRVPTPEEKKAALTQRPPYWRTWREFQSDIEELSDKLAREGLTAKLRVRFPIGRP